MKKAQLNYLTVQDILWINLQLTGKVHHFNFAKLEEATFYQYAYGPSSDVLSQATRFYKGFLKMSAIDDGNQATAFVALVSFLNLNGYNFCPSDKDASKKLGAEELSAITCKMDGHHHEVSARQAIEVVLKTYPKTAASLLKL